MSYLDDIKTYPHREDMFRRSESSEAELARQVERDRRRAVHFAAKPVVCEPCANSSHTTCVRPCVCPTQRREEHRGEAGE